ncbi:malto-oligosyltrehalose trehalohydrolase [Floridanema evergladense]|uniref:Malto-oligosyltrehalose trehalohydrolase n=1 Tax=Floridaenema evergladense BLCC-F167 TaxID=3153639 RepID=A0ABV4WSL1_9CYAN
MVKVGANYLGNDRCQFTVWAPLLKEVAVKIVSPNEQLLPMQQLEYGFWQVTAEDIEPGSRYVYQLEGTKEFPDPASYFQPEGVHKASEVFDHSTFNWTDRDWKGIRLEDYIIYELHIGTFTPEGTFEAVIPRLTRLKELGINAIEIMPVSQFPGDRNWGYDGVYPYAVQDSYGGPDGFKKLINACHLEGIAVILDVVYNHLGPEGNYLPNFGPYFTKKYLGDWGDAPNLDFAYCDGVREYFLENALYWLDIFHVDALRLDAVQGIYDFSAKHFLEELAERVHALSQQKGRKFYLTAESDFNDVRIIRPKEVGGYGLDAQWCDDFHHSLHTLITGEQQKYYKDFGKCKDLEKSLREGFVYSGQYSPDRKRRHGNSSAEEPAYKFIVCAQNHDQTGNRILGERMTKLTSFEGLKLTAGTLILSPFIPLLFMGEEYGEEAPFFYFISHSDPDLIEAVRKSKKDEFLQAGHEKDFQDPQDQGTFNKCVLNWEQQYQDKHKVLWDFYQELIFLRRINEALKVLDKKRLEVSSREEEKLLFMRRYSDENQVFYVMNFSDRTLTFDIETPSGSWQKLLDSADTKWMGLSATMPDKLIPGELLTIPAKSFVLYQA